MEGEAATFAVRKLTSSEISRKRGSSRSIPRKDRLKSRAIIEDFTEWDREDKRGRDEREEGPQEKFEEIWRVPPKKTSKI